MPMRTQLRRVVRNHARADGCDRHARRSTGEQAGQPADPRGLCCGSYGRGREVCSEVRASVRSGGCRCAFPATDQPSVRQFTGGNWGTAGNHTAAADKHPFPRNGGENSCCCIASGTFFDCDKFCCQLVRPGKFDEPADSPGCLAGYNAKSSCQPVPGVNRFAANCPASPLAPPLSPTQAAPIGPSSRQHSLSLPSDRSRNRRLRLLHRASRHGTRSTPATDWCPPLCFDGYCPVSMRNTWKWVAGNPQFGVVHRGQRTGSPLQRNRNNSGQIPIATRRHYRAWIPCWHSITNNRCRGNVSTASTTMDCSTCSPANRPYSSSRPIPQRYAAGVRQAMGIPRGRLVR